MPKKPNVLSYGTNHYLPGISNSIHAEHSCINKLPYSREPVYVNLLVVRFSQGGQLCNSKPCPKCINMMNSYFPKKGYIVRRIWYSNEKGQIVKSSLGKLGNSI